MTWVFVILSNLNDINRKKGQSDVSIILGGQELWFAFFITILYVFSLLFPNNSK